MNIKNFYRRLWRYLFSPDLILELNSGLSNRLIALATANIACREKQKKLKIMWNRNQYCGSDFSELFDNDFERAKEGLLADYNDVNSFMPGCLTAYKTMFYSDPTYRKFSKALADDHRASFSLGIEEKDLWSIHLELQSLVVKKNIAERMIALPPFTVGVHIRKSDLYWKNRLEDSWFEKKMETLIGNDDRTYFFFATDCSFTKARFTNRFGDRVLSYDFKLEGPTDSVSKRRREVEGVQEALLDLLTLSKTSKIIGSYSSAYSWLASIWGLTPLECSQPK